jgi:drug/metabolite transporter (DMT)-like permease
MFYAIAVIVALFASMGHIFFKKFALKTSRPMPRGLLDGHLAFGIILFGSSVILSIIAMRFIDFSAFYSFTALNYLFISIFARRFLGERFDKSKIVGNLIIIAGILIYNL